MNFEFLVYLLVGYSLICSIITDTNIIFTNIIVVISIINIIEIIQRFETIELESNRIKRQANGKSNLLLIFQNFENTHLIFNEILFYFDKMIYCTVT